MATQTVIGTVALIAALNVAVDALLPSPPAIEVHSLTFDGQTVTQDRTVTGSGDAFYMSWAASVIDLDTGAPVQHCSGNGAFAYATGRKAVQMDLPNWTGRDGCTPDSLPPGAYELHAVWSWGDQQKSAASEPFTIP